MKLTTLITLTALAIAGVSTSASAAHAQTTTQGENETTLVGHFLAEAFPGGSSPGLHFQRTTITGGAEGSSIWVDTGSIETAGGLRGADLYNATYAITGHYETHQYTSALTNTTENVQVFVIDAPAEKVFTL